MLNKITSGLQNLGVAMQLRSKRNEAITSNIANQDTPEYKARDFDFAKAMSNATGLSMRLSGSPIDNGPRLAPVSMAISSQAHIAPVLIHPLTGCTARQRWVLLTETPLTPNSKEQLLQRT